MVYWIFISFGIFLFGEERGFREVRDFFFAFVVGVFVDIQFKPEIYPIFTVEHTAFVVVGFYNGLYDGKADAGAAIAAGTGFIAFIEAEPGSYPVLPRGWDPLR